MITTELDIPLRRFGLRTRGAFHPPPDEPISSNMATLVLIGNTGPDMWLNFSKDMPASAEPLDDWTRNVLEPIASTFGAEAVYPFDGPPHHPFQRWAMQADDVTQSPIGPLVHPVYGMWHAYRAAFLFADRLDIPAPARTPSPCATCADKPCLNTCPVAAFRPQFYDVAGCRAHIASDAGRPCLENACMARRACPVGRDYIYEPAQATFHTRHFLRSMQQWNPPSAS